LAVLQRRQAAFLVELAHEHGDRGRLLAKERKQRREERREAARCRQADRGRTLAADALAQPSACALELARDDGGVGEEDFAFGCEVHEPRAASAADQLDADRTLERRDLSADRALRVAKASGGSNEGIGP